MCRKDKGPCEAARKGTPVSCSHWCPHRASAVSLTLWHCMCCCTECSGVLRSSHQPGIFSNPGGLPPVWVPRSPGRAEGCSSWLYPLHPRPRAQSGTSSRGQAGAQTGLWALLHPQQPASHHRPCVQIAFPWVRSVPVDRPLVLSHKVAPGSLR